MSGTENNVNIHWNELTPDFRQLMASLGRTFNIRTPESAEEAEITYGWDKELNRLFQYFQDVFSGKIAPMSIDQENLLPLDRYLPIKTESGLIEILAGQYFSGEEQIGRLFTFRDDFSFFYDFETLSLVERLFLNPNHLTVRGGVHHEPDTEMAPTGFESLDPKILKELFLIEKDGDNLGVLEGSGGVGFRVLEPEVGSGYHFTCFTVFDYYFIESGPDYDTASTWAGLMDEGGIEFMTNVYQKLKNDINMLQNTVAKQSD